MKFRQFEFRLFPRIRNRKKKKTKLSHPDYPRDISLDKNCNLYRTDFPCFYDNLAAEANAPDIDNDCLLCTDNAKRSDNDCLLCTDNAKRSDTNTDLVHMKTFPLSELDTDIESSCSYKCSQCACAVDLMTSFSTQDGVLTGTCSETCPGASSTIPRTRTRIKTNPWLPSPRSTPSSSPTDQYQHFASYNAVGDQAGSLYMTRPSTLPLFSSSGVEFRAAMKSLTLPLHGLTDIPEHDHRAKINSCNYDSTFDTKEDVHEFKGETNKASPVLGLLKEDLNYETDISYSNSPVSEFLKCVKYEIDFDYEQTADDLLENSTFPRDDSFTSCLDKVAYTDIPEQEGPGCEANETARLLKFDDQIDLTFDDTNNNMQESVDTGYGSVSRDSDYMSSDEEFGIKTDSRCDMTSTQSVVKSPGSSFVEFDESARKKQEQKKTCPDKSAETRNRDDIDHMRDIDQISDIDSSSDNDESSYNDQTSDLEWDDEPVTQTLVLKFPAVSELSSDVGGNKTLHPDGLMSEQDDIFQSPIKRYGSVKYRRNIRSQSECICNRRRSRSLADIELSLDEKVNLLREEKTFVQRKIHAAILEEKVREHQLKIFRLLSGDKRKQLIMKTLHDLKTRLEDQSARLQASYTTVISLQNLFSKRGRDHAVLGADN